MGILFIKTAKQTKFFMVLIQTTHQKCLMKDVMGK